MFGIIVGMSVRYALKPAWNERVASLLHTLRVWPWRDTIHTLAQRFREDRLGLTASSLTFTTLIALVPMFTVMLAVFSALPAFSEFQVALQKYLLQGLVPDSIAKPVLGALTQFAANAKRLGAAGFVILVFTALALMMTIDGTLNAIWRVREPRPIAQRLMVYWAAVTLGPLLLGISLTLTSYAISASQGWFGGKMSGSVALFINTLEFLLLGFGMAALFHFVPNTHVRWRHALAGGFFVAVGIEVAKKLLAWYVGSVPTYSTVYGAFATLPILLMWIYFAWVVVLLGAVIAAYAPSLRMKVVRRTTAPGHAFGLAIELLRELSQAKVDARHGLTAGELAQRLLADPLQIEPLIDALVALDWVGRLDEGEEQRIVLLADTATNALPLVSDLLLAPSPGVRSFWRRARIDELTIADLIRD
jgi:membrane protein